LGETSLKEAGDPAEENEGATIWMQESTDEWTEELWKVFKVFARARSWGGKEWELCVAWLISLEKAWEHPAKGLLTAPNSSDEHPGEVGKFM
jgi:hypothetical protein